MYSRGSKSGKAFRSVTGVLMFAIVMVQGMPLAAYAEEVAPADAAAPATTEIETGDAVSNTDVNNTVNTGVTDTPAPGGEGSVEDDPDDVLPADDSTPPEIPDDVPVEGMDITVENESEAAVENNIEQDGESGLNEASAEEGDVLIGAGKAVVTAEVVNAINTNITDSDGALYLINRLFGDSIDLSDLFWMFGDGSGVGQCQPGECGVPIENYSVHSTSTVQLKNTAVLRGVSGQNAATSTEGNASVKTDKVAIGYAGINLVGTNLVQSNYLLLALNQLGSIVGDVILPNETFFEALFKSVPAPAQNASIQNTNDSTVGTEIGILGDAGGNNATSTDASCAAEINTGNVFSANSVVNEVNSNLFGGANIRMLFQVAGNWSGEIFGLPEYLDWQVTPNGIEVFSKDVFETSNSTSPIANLDVTNNGTNDVENDITLEGISGQNDAVGECASVESGDIYAGAAQLNIVGTNVVGQNWVLAVFNILGDWNGNLSFGQPDLWIGAAVSGESEVKPGSELRYSFTVANMGNADATNVVITPDFSEHLIDFPDLTGSWNLGTIEAGETVEVVYNGTVAKALPAGDIPLELVATVDSRESDRDESNNTERVAVIIRTGPVVGKLDSQYTPPSNLTLTKSASVSSLTTPASVDYTVTIENKGAGPAYHAEFVDTLTDPKGNIMNQDVWELGSIAAGEVITITYTTEFTGNLQAGTYVNSAQVLAYSDHPSLDPFLGREGNSPVVQVNVEVLPKPVEEVAEEVKECRAYLTSYLSPSRPNDPAEVRKLQEFLNTYENAGVLVTGVFDEATEAAVAAFQTKYRASVLDPWGIPQATGYVYYTTRRQINELVCAGITQFILSPEQIAEIAAFRDQAQALLRDGRNVPVNENVGAAPATPTLATAPAPEEKEPETMTAAAAAAVTPAPETPKTRVRTLKDLLENFRNLFSWGREAVSQR